MARQTSDKQVADCRIVQQELTAYLRQELSAVRQVTVQRHLLQCDSCSLLVQHARSFDADLRQEARRSAQSLAKLSPENSADIQENVYRRMRRALFFQRTLRATQQLGTAALFLMFLAALLLVFNPWRQQLASLSTAAPTGIAANAVAPAPTTEVAAVPATSEPVATTAPLTTMPEIAALPTPQVEPAELVVFAPPSEPPDVAAQSIIAAAITADDAALSRLLARSNPLPEASIRVWRRLERCAGQFTADELSYRIIMHRDRFASIYVFDASEAYLGDIKMWVDLDGNWFVGTMNYSSFTALKHQCLE